MTFSSGNRVDVLIIGAGPAGLMLALCLKRLGVSARIIDKRSSRVKRGHADGLSPRSLEIFSSFGMLDAVKKEGAVPIHEISTWTPTADGKTIRRLRRDIFPSGARHSPFVELNLQQNAIEGIMLDAIKAAGSGGELEVERAVVPTALHVDTGGATNVDKDPDVHPISVTVRHLHPDSGNVYDETVQAKFVVGCDGAHSWTRNELGISMETTTTDLLFGVLDMVPITNFPEMQNMKTLPSMLTFPPSVRKTCIVCSTAGSLLIVPRERGMCRFYTQIQNGEAALLPGQVDEKTIIDSLQKILVPYHITSGYTDWFTGYQIRQGLATAFQDASHCVFLAGDALHTHSPKAGQGMNSSMADAHNLAWKLAGVLGGAYKRKILSTYEVERRPVAKQVLDIDRLLAQAYATADHPGLVANLYEEHGEFLDGTGICYVAKEEEDNNKGDIDGVENTIPALVSINNENKKHPLLTSDLVPGARVPPQRIAAQASAQPFDLHSLLTLERHWAIMILAGDISSPTQLARVNAVGEGIRTRCSPPFRNWLERWAHLLVVHTAPLTEIECEMFDEAFFPASKGDYSKCVVYADEPMFQQGGIRLHEMCGADTERGALLVVRPDQHVGLITTLENLEAVEHYFRGFAELD